MKVNIYIETDIKGFAKTDGFYAYTVEYITMSGKVELRTQVHKASNVTVQELQLIALERAISILTKPCNIEISIDKMQIANMIERELPAMWEKNNWIKSDGKTVAHSGLWQQLSNTMRPHTLRFVEHSDCLYTKSMRKSISDLRKESENQNESNSSK